MKRYSFLVYMVFFGLKAQPNMDSLLTDARTLVTKQKFAQANQTYEHILSYVDVVPAEICYFFAQSLHATYRYHEASRFLHFYLNYVTQDQQYMDAAQTLLLHTQTILDAVRTCNLCDAQGFRYEFHVLCQGKGTLQVVCTSCAGQRRVICTQCYGQKIVLSRDIFKQILYLPCVSCEGTGQQVCVNCKGKGTIQKPCIHCSETGKVQGHMLCTHK